MADYAAIEETSRKPNVLGADLQVLIGAPAPLPEAQARLVNTPPFAIFVNVAVPPELAGEEFVLSVDLRDALGELVNMPGGTDADKLRITQIVRVDDSPSAGLGIPRRTLWPRFNLAISFANGLQLVGGQAYRWVLQIDGSSREEWETDFFLTGPPVPPLLG
jgi:hypothetical protein